MPHKWKFVTALAFVSLALASYVILGVSQDIIGAARRGYFWRVRQIIGKSRGEMFKTDSKGNTPAVWAILNDHTDIAKYLVEHGYPLGRTNQTPFPLTMACTSRHSSKSNDMLKYLLEKGADPNELYPEEGWRPLMMAVNNYMPEKVQLLVQHGADIDRPNPNRERDGLSALELAKKNVADLENPKIHLPEEMEDTPEVRERLVKQWSEMVRLLEELKKQTPEKKAG